MKIIHSIIILTLVILLTGSIIKNRMDLNKTTKNAFTNVVEAKRRYSEGRASSFDNKKQEESINKKSDDKSDNDKVVQEKALYKLKLNH